MLHPWCNVAYHLDPMSTANPALVSLIGERVRARRHARGFTLDELADRSGVSRRMLVNVEQGASNASIATLLRLSEALGIGLPDLVAPDDTPGALEIKVGGSRSPLWTGPNGGEAMLTAAITAPDVVELWDWTLGPGDAHASEPHVTGARELLHVIEGEIVLAVGDDEAVLCTGDAASFAGDTVHVYRNEGPARARFSLTVFEPTPATRVPR
jgi:transcriptional regulator with XRE-family HTH domain